MKFKSLFLTASLALSLLVSATSAMAAGYMPFILGSSSGDSVSVVVDKTKQALTENGFEVVGSYKPNADSEVIVVTNDALKNLAGLSKTAVSVPWNAFPWSNVVTRPKCLTPTRPTCGMCIAWMVISSRCKPLWKSLGQPERLWCR